MIAFNLVPHPPGLVAAVPASEFGIELRNGCFGAHPCVMHLLGRGREEALQVRARMAAGDCWDLRGTVRMSFGGYNTVEEVDLLAEAPGTIARGEPRGTYVQDPRTGEYAAPGWAPRSAGQFQLCGAT